MYPDVIEGVKKEISAEEVIFEGEAIGFDPHTGNFLPFQETSQRKRKYGIEEKAKEIRDFIISLSGRLMKRGVEYTTPALLAGMWQLLAIIDALERFTSKELFEIAKEFLDIRHYLK